MDQLDSSRSNKSMTVTYNRVVKTSGNEENGVYETSERKGFESGSKVLDSSKVINFAPFKISECTQIQESSIVFSKSSELIVDSSNSEYFLKLHEIIKVHNLKKG